MVYLCNVNDMPDRVWILPSGFVDIFIRVWEDESSNLSVDYINSNELRIFKGKMDSIVEYIPK
uniref:Uncharacterized protein n=1 Tax=viral metagenome TaxID=1070528 RepID=A0A6H1ZAI1_9ZZZZ